VVEAFERLVIAGLAEARFDVSECARALVLTAR
jgi:hypothetical protein